MNRRGEAGRPGTLFVVSTPIGNLGDVSLRAIETLTTVAAVLAEDTRHTVHLLERYEIATPLLPYHEHNEARVTPGLVKRLLEGASFALVSDAGTPLVSDPGSRLVGAAVEAGITVSPVPGASALLAALTASGLLVDRFTFFGFLSRTGQNRRTEIDAIVTLRHVAVLYEASNRVANTLRELAESGASERATVVARELTKRFEEMRRGTLADLAAYYEKLPPRGEIVIVIAGAAAREPVGEEKLLARAGELRSSGLTTREVVRGLMAELGASRNLAYRIAHR